jgi:hypothetical protein
MKIRSTFPFAIPLIVATLGSTSSVAFAATAEAGALPAGVRQVDGSTPGGTSDPSAAPVVAPVPGQPAPGALTVATDGETAGTAAPVAPGTDLPPAEEKKKEPGGFLEKIAGSSLFFQTGATLGTFVKSYQPDYNPTVESFLSFAPRYTINKDWQLRGRLAVSYEFTNSDSSRYRNEPLLGDASVNLFYRGVPAVGGKQKFKFQPFVGLAFPTSKASRARTMVTSASVGVQASTQIEHFLKGEMLIASTLTLAHPFYRQTTGVTDASGVPQGSYSGDSVTNTATFTGNDRQLGGFSPANTFTWNVLVAPEWGKWSPGLFFLMSHQFMYEGKDVQYAGKTVPRSDAPGVRQTFYTSLWLDYHLNDWLTPELGYQYSGNIISDGGNYRNPVFSQYSDGVIYLGANVQIDEFIKSMKGGDKSGGGVVRTKNERKPMQFL